MQQGEYNAAAKALHWLVALLVFVLFPLAWVMDDFTNPIQKFQAYNLHKSLGITVLALMAVRLGWRLLTGAPALPLSIPPLERAAAKLGHLALYIALFLMPLTGWAMISASNKPSILFQSRPFPSFPGSPSFPPIGRNPTRNCSWLPIAFFRISSWR